MTSKKETVKFEWQITNKFLSTTTWVYSEQFFSNFNRDSFDIGLQVTTDYKNLKVRVRKTDPRSASAGVMIEIYKNHVHMLTLSEQQPHRPYTPNNFNSLRVLAPMKQHKTFIDWREQCTFDKFSSFAGDNNEPVQLVSFADCFIKEMFIHCTIEWHGFNKPDELKTVPLQVFKPFFKEDEYSDVIIEVEEHQLPAHKIILAAHSPYFNTMFSTDMKESKENRVEIKNFTVEIITEMLEFFYTNKTKASEDIDIALKMIPVADMYQIKSLKNICEATLSGQINRDNVLDIFSIADSYNVADLRRKAMDFMKQNRRHVVNLPEFRNFYLTKPEIMFEFTYAIGNL